MNGVDKRGLQHGKRRQGIVVHDGAGEAHREPVKVEVCNPFKIGSVEAVVMGVFGFNQHHGVFLDCAEH